MPAHPAGAERCEECQELHDLPIPATPEREPRSARDVPAERACLRCGKAFDSEGFHNRICAPCANETAGIFYGEAYQLAEDLEIEDAVIEAA